MPTTTACSTRNGRRFVATAGRLRAAFALASGVILAILGFALRSEAAELPERPIDSVSRRVVKIFGAGGIKGLYSYSTGFLVSPEGHIVTVWSHVLDGDSVTVVLGDGRRLEGKILGAEPQLDLAVLKIDGEDFPYFNLDDAVSAPVGSRVLAFSNMFKVAAGDEPVSVLHGVIAAKTKLSARKGSFETPYTGPVYVVDAITNNPGSGGGVLTTRDGTLVAMIGKELRNSQTNTWINYAIPISELRTTIGEIISGKFVARTDQTRDVANPRRYAPVDFGLVLVPDVLLRTPAYVDSVIGDSPAERAGILPNDLVLFVNDELVQSCRMLSDVLGRLEAGDTLKLVVRRGNTLVPVELPVEKKADSGTRPADDSGDDDSIE